MSGPAGTPIPGEGRVVGVDLGARRVGIAVSDSSQRVATPVTAVVRSGDPEADRRRLAGLVEEYEAVGVVAGLPRSLSGDLGPAATAALAELDRLRERVGVPVDTVDERLTTVSAAAALRQAGRPARRQRSVIDATAASIILQSWLDRRGVVPRSGHPAGGAAR